MNSLKNTIVAILLLGVSYGVYQILTTADPKALSTAEFHAASEPKIELPESFSPAPPPLTHDDDEPSAAVSQPEPPQLNAPPVAAPANRTLPNPLANPLPNPLANPPANPPADASGPASKFSASPAPASPAPWTSLPANQGNQFPALGANEPVRSNNTPAGRNSSASTTPPLNSFPPSSTLPEPAPASALPFSPLGGVAAPTSDNASKSQAAAIPAQTAPGAVGLTSVSAPLPTLENSLQTARQLVAAGQMRQALEELSGQIHNPELATLDQSMLYKWLDTLAGKVIYSSEHHINSQPHIVQANETLASLADAWRVPPQLVYNINRERISNPFELVPGTELKRVSGPFRAELDLTNQTLTLFLDGLYAGRFRCVSLASNLSAGSWKIENKVENGHPAGQFLMQTNQPEVNLHAQPADGNPTGCCFAQGDARDLFSILSVGSEIKVIR